MKKTLKVLTLVVVLSLSMVFCAVAAEDSIKVAINDSYIDFTDAAPIAMDGRTMVPVRAIFEAMDAEVGYDAETQVITATFTDGSVMTLTIGSDELVVIPKDGEPVATVMDVTPWIDTAANRTYIPARFVAEATGLAVDWDGINRVVHVTDYAALAAEFGENLTIYNELMAVSGEMPKGKNIFMDMTMSMDVEDVAVDFTAKLNMSDTAFTGTIDLTTNMPEMEKLSTVLAANMDEQMLYVKLNDIAPLLGLAGPATGDFWGTMDLSSLIDPALLEVDATKASSDVAEMFETILSTSYSPDMGVSPTTFARMMNDLIVSFFGDDVATKTTVGGKTTYKFDADMAGINDMIAAMGEAMPAAVNGKMVAVYVVENKAVVDMTMDMTIKMDVEGEVMDMTIKLGLTTDPVTMPKATDAVDLMELLAPIFFG